MSEFLAAIAGAVVGGIITYMVQMIALREARKQRTEDAQMRQKALGYALLFKMTSLYSHLRGLRSQIDKASAQANAAGFRGEMWQYVLPTVNLPDHIHFTTDEMVMLLALKNNDLFNELAAMDERHNTTLIGFAAYSDSRMKLGSMLPSLMHGNVGTAELNDEQMRVVRPRMVEVNSLIEALYVQCQSQEREAWDVLTRLNVALASSVGISVKLEQKSDEEFGAKNPAIK